MRSFGVGLLLASAAMPMGSAWANDAPPVEEQRDDEVTITGSRVANASINGLDVDPLLLPQNVRLLGAELVDQAGFVDLSQLFDLAGGMARQNSFGGAWDAYAIRGFSGDINQGPDLLINRFGANRGFNARRDVATVESFQVLKGPASALSGKGEPGGSINIVTKAPLDRFHAGGELSYGSFDTARGMFDIGGPASDGIAARVIGVYQTSDGFRDFTPSDRLLIAPSLSARAGDSVRFLYQLEYNLVHFTHDRGLVAVNGDAKALPRERFLGEPNDGQIEQRTTQHQGSVTIDLAEGIALEAGVQYRDGSMVGQSTHNSALVGTRLRRQLRVHDYSWEDVAGRIELSANGSLAGIDHQFRVGGDAFSYDQRRIFWRFSPSAATPYDIDIFNPVYGQPKPVATLNQDLLEQLRGESLYAQDLLTLGKHFSLLLGIRHDWIRQENVNYRNGRTDRQSPSATSPRAAFTFAPSAQVSAYVSWGKSFRFNQGVDVASNPFAAERGEALEGGVKFALADKKLTGTVSVYRITKDNVLVADPANSGFSVATGRARSKGVEADLNYAMDDRLTLTAVYAYTDAKVIADTRPALVGSGLSNVPKHSGAMYGHWQSGGRERGSWGVGAGLTYVGERPGDDVASGFMLDDYVTARVNLSYRVNKALSLHLDAENLFDAVYSESSYSTVWITPGAPRTIRARLAVAL
ncbi:TonB-dependent siderophore receptor [Sphingomonas sp.]|jgi:iron complex outermembrane receptor protein|uniref:TonB-dependent siderophore receptor n=1 Tax=Sphingomonas sp. TaxID=28214 RepID=UPI002E12E779|nr:TonB-dependent siderophore receptor [Sphingomonas sp.]HEV7290545.1 TonB-dependent siderophore receptor [Sphingomonas sp.]